MKLKLKPKYFKYFILIFISVGCQFEEEPRPKVIKLELSQKNPVSFVFDFPKERIKEVLKSGIFSQYDSHNQFLTSFYKINEKNPFLPDSLKFLEHEEYFEIGFNRNHFPMSRLYVSEELEPLPNHSAYLIRMLPVSKNKTEVNITTLCNEVMLHTESMKSKELAFLSCNSHRLPTMVIIEPSTIEEYEILQLIGQSLGIKDKMPRINYPDYSNLTIIHFEDIYIYMDEVLNNGKNDKWKKN
ncbi:MAG: hypothetical protein ACM3O3_03280 [Syntrophothermus sp.]